MRHRTFAAIWITGAISDAGTWMQSVALGALTTTITHAASWGAAVAGVSFFMSGLVNPLAGVLADQHDRRVIIRSVTSVLALLALVLAGVYVTGHINPILILVIVGFEGLLSAFIPPTRGAMLPDLVPLDQVLDASALGSFSWNFGRIAGSAIGGVLLIWGSYSWIFLINAVTFVGVAVAMFFVDVRVPEPEVGVSVWQRLRDGWNGMMSESGCRSSVALVVTIGLLVAPFIALIPAMAQLQLHGNETATARLVMFQGVGAVVAALSLSPLGNRFGRRRMLLSWVAFLPIAAVLYSQSRSVTFAAATLCVLSMIYISIVTGLLAIVQLRSPASIRARVIGIQFSALSISYPVGSVIFGRLGDHIGVGNSMTVGAAFFGVVVLGVWLFKRQWLSDLNEIASYS